MNEMVVFPKGIELAASARLEDQIIKGIKKFEELKAAKLFSKETEWENDRWSYLANGGEGILFCNSAAERNAEELINAFKVFIISYLYENRLKGSLPTLQGKCYGFRRLIQITEITKKEELNQDVYLSFINEINQLEIRTKIGLISGCNQVIQWLQRRNLLTTPIDLVKPKSSSQLPAIKEKMPSRDLIQAILEAKWKVAEREDDSLTWVNDMLAVLAQSFQYGMGLRIGEVLRLPANPIRRVDGKMFFIVWTEKGAPPIARYIPKEWEEVFEYAVNEIKRITEPFRRRAKELETYGRLSEVEDRLSYFINKKTKAIEGTIESLCSFLQTKKKQAKIDWLSSMRGEINPERYYLPTELRNLLPIEVTSDAYNSFLIRETLKIAGIEFKPIHGGFTKCKKQMWHVKGSDVINCINQHIKFRAEHITYDELFEIIHERENKLAKCENSIFEENTLKISGTGGSFRTFTMRGKDNFSKRGPCKRVIDIGGAKRIIKYYCGGGYDYTKWIDATNFQQLFGDLLGGSVSVFGKGGSRRGARFYLLVSDKKTKYIHLPIKSSSLKYISAIGYLVEQESIHNYILSQFKALNLNIESEIYSDRKNDTENTEISVVISSESFYIKQKVSDYLMISAAGDNSGGKPLIPLIHSYQKIKDSFKGRDYYEGNRHKLIKSLFQRYDIADDLQLANEFQTHKGRHWKTTSLFKSGASHEIVNLWMGRDPSQGSQYDHRSDSERAHLIKKSLKSDSTRFVGHIASKLRQLQEQDMHQELIDDYLDSEIKVVQNSPNGCCTRELAIKPCDLYMRCLYGKDGKGCKHFIFDLGDPGQTQRLSAWVDAESAEVTRLEGLREQGFAAAQMHLDAKTPSLKNAQMILDTVKKNHSLPGNELRPFRLMGSDPSDCPFECGE